MGSLFSPQTAQTPYAGTTNTAQNYSQNQSGTGTSTYSANAAPQLEGAISQAQQAFQTPVNVPLQGVAGLTPEQQAAIQNIYGAQGTANPYFQAAQGYTQQSAAPITGDDVSQYLNPYAKYVNQAQNQLFGQQMRETTGKTTQLAGGVGAERIGLAQGNLAQQQGLAAGQTNAGIYQAALQAAQQQKAQAGQAGFAEAAMGPAAQQAQLSGASALFGAGTAAQQTQQAGLTAQYQQALQQAYAPQQAAAQYAQILAGLSGQLGGTTSQNTSQSGYGAQTGTGSQQGYTTQLGPSLGSQIIGAITALAGTAAKGIGGGGGGSKRGGRINPYATGGSVMARHMNGNGYASGGTTEYYEPGMSEDITGDYYDDTQGSGPNAQVGAYTGAGSTPSANRFAQAGETALTYGNKLLNAQMPRQGNTGPDMSSVMAQLMQPRPRMFADGGDVDGDDAPDYASAIRQIESGSPQGNYSAVTDAGKGRKALGAYQVLDTNVPSWTKEALGESMSPDQFLKDKSAQDATFNHHWGKYLAQTGSPQDAASMWHSGVPLAQAQGRRDVLGTATPDYVNKFSALIGKPGSSPAPMQNAYAANGAPPSSGSSAYPMMASAEQGEPENPKEKGLQLYEAGLALKQQAQQPQGQTNGKLPTEELMAMLMKPIHPRMAASGGAIKGYASGGVDSGIYADDDGNPYTPTFNDRFTASDSPASLGMESVNPYTASKVAPSTTPYIGIDSATKNPTQIDNPYNIQKAPEFPADPINPEMRDAEGPTVDMSAQAKKQDRMPMSAAAATPASSNPYAVPSQTKQERLGDALMSAGFAMMASQSPWFGVAIGQGGLAGTQSWIDSRSRQQNTAMQQQKMMLEQAQEQRARSQTQLEKEKFDWTKGKPETIQTLLGPKSVIRSPDGTIRDAATGETISQPGVQATAASGKPSEAAMMKAMDDGKHGAEFIAAVPNPMLRNAVEAAANYDAPITIASKRAGAGINQDKFLALVRQANPEYDMYGASAHGAALKEFMAGGQNSPAGQITYGNTAISHAGTAYDALQKLKAMPGFMAEVQKSGLPFISYAAAKLKNASVRGTPEGVALNEYLTASDLYGAEVSRLYSGSQGSQEERNTVRAPLDKNLSLPELEAGLRTSVNMIKGRTDALQDRYHTAMTLPGLQQYGTKKEIKDFPVIHQKAEQAIAKINSGAPAVTAPPAAGSPAPAIQPDPGPGKRQIGQTYMTPNGPKKWIGQ